MSTLLAAVTIAALAPLDGRRYDIKPKGSGFRARSACTRVEIFFRRLNSAGLLG